MIAVRTTGLRTIETIYWMGAKIKAGKPIEPVRQWDPYEYEAIPAAESISLLLESFSKSGLSKWVGVTALLIAPPYKVSMVQGIITNFHQPASTLLLLVAALTGGDKWKKIYQHAMENNYRFLSYGDSSLLMAEQI